MDAPVVGSLQPARDGTLGIVVGGSDEDVAAARPLMELWGAPDRIRHLGPVGSGNAMKAVINMGLGIAMAGVGEAMRLGAELSLPQDAVLDALEAGPFGFSVKQKGEMLANGDFTPPSFSLDLMAKDLRVALEGAGRRGCRIDDAAGQSWISPKPRRRQGTAMTTTRRWRVIARRVRCRASGGCGSSPARRCVASSR